MEKQLGYESYTRTQKSKLSLSQSLRGDTVFDLTDTRFTYFHVVGQICNIIVTKMSKYENKKIKRFGATRVPR